MNILMKMEFVEVIIIFMMKIKNRYLKNFIFKIKKKQMKINYIKIPKILYIILKGV